MPKGHQRLEVTLANGKVITFHATSEWTTAAGGGHLTCACVTVDLTEDVSLPLSVVGLIVKESPFSLSMPSVGECRGATLTDKQVQQLATDSAVPRSVFLGVRTAIPDWLEFRPVTAKTGDLSSLSDAALRFGSGGSVRGIGGCEVRGRSRKTAGMLLCSSPLVAVVAGNF